jgi:NAD kinase
MKIEYAILVKNKTRLETLIERFNTKAQAKFYIEHLGGEFEDYEAEHEQFHQVLSLIQSQLSTVIKNKLIDRSFLPSFLFNKNQLVIVIGQDGLVANTAKYVNQLPIIAINPDPQRYDGVLLPFHAHNFLSAVEKVLNNNYQATIESLIEAKLNDSQRLLAFNDLFIGVASHTSARYKITFSNQSEIQSSSGIIVSTKAGSTGWLSSVFKMAEQLCDFMDAPSKAKKTKKSIRLQSDQLMFVVREPFQSKTSQANLTAGILEHSNQLVIESFMPTNGVIFSDGIESDFLKFNAGSIATIRIAQETARLVIK